MGVLIGGKKKYHNWKEHCNECGTKKMDDDLSDEFCNICFQGRFNRKVESASDYNVDYGMTGGGEHSGRGLSIADDQ